MGRRIPWADVRGVLVDVNGLAMLEMAVTVDLLKALEAGLVVNGYDPAHAARVARVAVERWAQGVDQCSPRLAGAARQAVAGTRADPALTVRASVATVPARWLR